jgi:hypothetical protein
VVIILTNSLERPIFECPICRKSRFSGHSEKILKSALGRMNEMRGQTNWPKESRFGFHPSTIFTDYGSGVADLLGVFTEYSGRPNYILIRSLL